MRATRVIFAALLLVSAAFGQAGDAFDRDLRTLAAGDHRLAGSPASNAASDHVQARLEQIGLDEVFTLDMPMWRTGVATCRITVEGRTVDLLPFRPNVIVPPVTDEDGLTAPMIYVGHGDLDDFDRKQVRNAIVVFDYACGTNWKTAFALGAKAVLMLGNRQDTPVEPRHVPVPANLLRLYVPAEAQGKIDFRASHDEAKIVSHVHWELGHARNVIGLLKGTKRLEWERAKAEYDAAVAAGREEATAPEKPNLEVVILSADLDTYGQVPHRSPGARRAANVAALLQTAEHMTRQRAERDIVIAFFDGQRHTDQGCRYFYSALKNGEFDDLVEEHTAERRYVDHVLKTFAGGPEAIRALSDEQWNAERFEQLEQAIDEAKQAEDEQAVKRLESQLAALKQERVARLELHHRIHQAMFDEARARRDDISLTKIKLGARVARLAQAIRLMSAEFEKRRKRGEGEQFETNTALLRENLQYLRETIAEVEEQMGDRLKVLADSEERRAKYEFVIARTWRRPADADEDAEPGLLERLAPLPDVDERLSAAIGREVLRALDLRTHMEAWILAWDDAQRALDNDSLDMAAHLKHEDSQDGLTLNPYKLRTVLAETTRRFEHRAEELDLVGRRDEQTRRLREALGEANILLHVGFNFSDGGPTWGVVVGDARRTLWGAGSSSSDAPGFYSRVLTAFRRTYEQLGRDLAIETRTLSDPDEGPAFVCGEVISTVTPAGTYGIFNVQLMTGHDARPRDGHPADTLDRLDAAKIQRHAAEATVLLDAAVRFEGLSVRRMFGSVALDRPIRWNDHKKNGSGNFAGLQVTGSLKEDRAAAAALIATFSTPGGMKTQPWTRLAQIEHHLAYNPLILEPANANGNFAMIGLRKDKHNNATNLGAQFDEFGQVSAISNQDKLWSDAPGKTRANLFPAQGYALGYPLLGKSDPRTWKVLHAASDSPLRATRTLDGEVDGIGFFYVPTTTSIRRIKVFQETGPVLLGITKQAPYGRGVELSRLETPPPVGQITAQDKAQLNETRLSMLRRRSVTRPDLEALHSRATLGLQRAEKTDQVAEREAQLARSSALSRRVYTPLRQSMDDLVHAVVWLLLLAIPFAFAMERLLVCSSSIYGRILGFTVMFLATFALLYWMHPGFAIASTPLIVFLAFAIILLSSLVIYIVIRKFKTELTAMQGRSSRMHSAQVSRMGTLIAAVNMGMSTMRRRPLRTTLTAVTVVILTFTILCFASLSSGLGVRRVYEGPADEQVAPDVFIRMLDYSDMSSDVTDVVAGFEGVDGRITQQWWLAREQTGAPPFSIAHPETGASLFVDGVMGVSPAEVEQWRALRTALGDATDEQKLNALAGDGVFLPAIIQEELGLEVGDEVLLHGYRVTFAGVLNANALQRLNQLDSKPILPVDFQDVSAQASTQQQDEEQQMLDEMVMKDFVRLSPNQVTVAGADLVRKMGGKLHVVNIYAGRNTEPAQIGRSVAEVLNMPIWSRTAEGVERMIFTTLTEVSGGLELVVPIVLGGLIIFGTMLGSITDREKEIYTFSALGLAPAHVGFLFFAEAAVYAVVGGLAGQLLAQAVALAAGKLAEMGVIRPASINFSSTNAMFALGVTMATVLLSAVYPALRASKSANPGVQRSWRMPAPEGDDLDMVFPFTVSAYDITGVISFLAEHFAQHDDAGLGVFAASGVRIGRDAESNNLYLSAHLALAPFDLGVTQDFRLTAVPSEIPGVDEVMIHAHRTSGTTGDWRRSNRTFIQDLRKQFLLWRTLSAEAIESYRIRTLETLGEAASASVTGEDSDPQTTDSSGQML